MYLAFTLLLAVFKSEGRSARSGGRGAARGRNRSGTEGSSGRAPMAKRLIHASPYLPGTANGNHSRGEANGGGSSSWEDTNGWGGSKQQQSGGAGLEGSYGAEEEVPPLKESYLQLW